MKIYKYDNYEEYVDIQTKANIKKIENIWVQESTIIEICKRYPTAKKILCHGTRNGAEQRYFHKHLSDAYIIGTDISHTANQYENTVQLDFHEVKAEWVDTFDIIYSNSFDHSYDPKKCLHTWLEQLNKSGILCVEMVFDPINNRMRASDPLEIAPDEFTNLVLQMNGNIVNRVKLKSHARSNNSILYFISKG